MTAFVSDPAADGVKVADRLFELEPKTCMILFYHGLGDLVQFQVALEALREQFPNTEFSLGLPKGLGYEAICPDAAFLEGADFNEKACELPVDMAVRCHFPMNESQTEFTKSEWCCIHELGIAPVAGHKMTYRYDTPLVAVHYQITCLPDSANPAPEVMTQVWQDVRDAGFVPLEVHFEHIFHNPVNTQPECVDATVRRCQPRVESLVGLMGWATAFVGAVSGPFHVALAVLPPERILLLEKDFKASCFTKHPIATADVRNYQHEVKAFLENLNGNYRTHPSSTTVSSTV